MVGCLQRLSQAKGILKHGKIGQFDMSLMVYYMNLVLICIAVSCSTKSQIISKDKVYDIYIEENFHNYEEIYSEVNDTLQYWINDKLQSVVSLIYYQPWQIDSVFIFNKDSTRFFTTVNVSLRGFKDAQSDYIEELNGARIDGQWHFYFGSLRIITRSVYQDSVYAPMTLEEISYLSHSKIMSPFLKVEGEDYLIDYDALDRFFIHRYRTSKGNIARIDSVILAQNASLRKRIIAKEEIDDVRAKMKASVRPPEPVDQGKSGKVKIFESEAWKNRNNKK